MTNLDRKRTMDCYYEFSDIYSKCAGKIRYLNPRGMDKIDLFDLSYSISDLITAIYTIEDHADFKGYVPQLSDAYKTLNKIIEENCAWNYNHTKRRLNYMIDLSQSTEYCVEILDKVEDSDVD